jgi:UDP-N-acetylglucosamine/UDP-N-acetylgalactosamine 4-epimerase
VTGGAGFIGSHLVRALLDHDQRVVVLDNMVSGRRSTLARVLEAVPEAARDRFRLIEGDIRDPAACREAVAGCDHVLHQAALGSVPGSIAAPQETYAVNVAGFVEVLIAARETGVRSLVYASSSAVYGDDPAPEKTEGQTGRLLSPYAASKKANEGSAEAFGMAYGMQTVGLRYFNVYGAGQDPEGPYAAVIPRWLAALVEDRDVIVNGDGLTTRDFCAVQDVVQANLRAALAPPAVSGQVFNIGAGQRTTLLDLLAELRFALAMTGVTSKSALIHGTFRAGDIRHSLADITRARAALGYAPSFDLRRGLATTVPHFLQTAGNDG